MGMKLFYRENWQRWIEDDFRASDPLRLDLSADIRLLTYIACHADGRPQAGAMKRLRLKARPTAVAGCDAQGDRYMQKWLVMQEQVMREPDYWVLKQAALEAPVDIARYAFCRLTGCSWPSAESPYSFEPLSCGLKADVRRADIEDLCRELIDRHAQLAPDAEAWLAQLPGIDDAQLVSWAEGRSERSFGPEEIEPLRRGLHAADGQPLSVEALNAQLRCLFDAYIACVSDPGDVCGFRPVGLNALDAWRGRLSIFMRRMLSQVTFPNSTAAIKAALVSSQALPDGLTDEAVRRAVGALSAADPRHVFFLAVAFEFGIDVPCDRAKAHHLYATAAASGNRYAAKALARMDGI